MGRLTIVHYYTTYLHILQGIEPLVEFRLFAGLLGFVLLKMDGNIVFLRNKNQIDRPIQVYVGNTVHGLNILWPKSK